MSGTPPSPSRTTARLWLLTLGIALAAAGLWSVLAVQGVGGPGFGVRWLAFVVAFAVAEVCVAHIEFRGEAHTLSLNEVVLVVGLFSLGPLWLPLAEILGAGLALAVVRRQQALKLAFNVAQYGLGTVLASLTFHALGGGQGALATPAWLAALAGAIVAGSIAVSSVSWAIALSGGDVDRRELRTSALFALGGSVTNTCVGLLLAISIAIKPLSVVFLVPPIILTYLAYQAWSRERARGRTVEFLYSSMRTLHTTADTEQAVSHLLGAAREMFAARRAEILVLVSDGPAGIHGVLADDELTIRTDLTPSPAERDVLALVAEVGTCVASRDGAPGALGHLLREKGLENAIVTPLRADSQVLGLLILGDRLGRVASFSDGDITPFETFAGHASIALQRDQLERSLRELTDLKEELYHQTRHDPLTGLANRRQFAERVSQALRPRVGALGAAAVLYLDLDDFKSVNDSLGHAAGDRILVEVAERLRACVRGTDLAARLGGDEFAILLARSSEQTVRVDADELAERVTAALDVPLTVNGSQVTVRGSVGVGVALGRHDTPDALLGRADAAMYEVKRTPSLGAIRLSGLSG